MNTTGTPSKALLKFGDNAEPTDGLDDLFNRRLSRRCLPVLGGAALATVVATTTTPWWRRLLGLGGNEAQAGASMLDTESDQSNANAKLVELVKSMRNVTGELTAVGTVTDEIANTDVATLNLASSTADGDHFRFGNLGWSPTFERVKMFVRNVENANERNIDGKFGRWEINNYLISATQQAQDIWQQDFENYLLAVLFNTDAYTYNAKTGELQINDNFASVEYHDGYDDVMSSGDLINALTPQRPGQASWLDIVAAAIPWR